MKQVLRWIFAASLSAPVLAQPAADAPRFEVATIKPADPVEIQRGSSGISTRNGRAVGTNVTLKRCIYGAYEIGPNQVVGGPPWIDSDRFDFEGRAPGDAGPNVTLDQMIQSMLVDRFHLVMHRETRNIEALVLEIGKKGPKLEKGDGGTGATDNGRGDLTVNNQTIDAFAEKLSRQTPLPVVNKTGLDGKFKIHLRWTLDADEAANKPGAPPTLYTAIQEQLGLRLTAKKTAVEVWVVDHAEKPTEN